MTAGSTLLQEQAKALGDPTRHAIFREVADAPQPIGVSELTDRFRLNHNAIRQHLAKLVAAGLVVQERVPTGGRGRPRLVYRVDPAADGRWGLAGPYERLSILFAELTSSGKSASEIGRRSVERFGLADDDGDPVERVIRAMARHGFAPEVQHVGERVGERVGDRVGEHEPERVEVVLGACPFAAAALIDPDTVCALHLGIAQGVAEATGGGVSVEQLVPGDPHQARCRLVLRVG